MNAPFNPITSGSPLGVDTGVGVASGKVTVRQVHSRWSRSQVLIDVAGLTDRGRARTKITDQFLIAELNKSVLIRRSTMPTVHERKLAAATVGHLLLVADAGGDSDNAQDSSSSVAVAAVDYVLALLPWFFDAVRRNGDASDKLVQRVDNVSRSLQPSFQIHEFPSLDSSLTIAFLVWPTLFVVHRGSSSVYLLRGDELHHLTADYSRRNVILREHARVAVAPNDRWRNGERWSAHATLPTTPIRVHQATIAEGDTILLCTDGLTRGVSDDALAAILREGRPPDSTCLMLIQAANSAGGSDNTSVVVAHALE